MKLGPGHGREWAGLSVSSFTHRDGLSAGQHLSDAFAQVNPLKKVPALKDGNFTLAER